MESRTKLFGHGMHPMLVVFPLGTLAMVVVFDLVRYVNGNPFWSELAFWLIPAGVLSGLIAAPFGAIDWFSIPSGTRASMIGFIHAVTNITVLALFAVSGWMRWADPASPASAALACSFVGGGLSLVGGWLGGELVERLGVGVDDGAHVDAPSSLTSRTTIRS
jgi:uncharacterized membrane protein